MKLNKNNMSDVEFGFTVLAKGTYTARLTGVEVKPNKQGDGNNLIVVHTILDPEIVAKDGKAIVNRGQFKITRWIGLQPNEEGTYDPDRVIKELGVAAGVIVNGDEDVTTESLQGAVVAVVLGVKPPEGQYKESNDVSGWKVPTPERRAIAESCPF